MDNWHGASWIGPEYDPRGDIGAYLFRRQFTLGEVPKEFPILITADQRFRLHVNGVLVALGPARGDASHWQYDAVDLAPHLKAGPNELKIVVWSFGRFAPMAQHTVRTGLIVGHPEVGTPKEWETARLPGWDFAMMHSDVGHFYIDVGPGEVFDFRETELEWKKPNSISGAELRGQLGGGTPWCLVASQIPRLTYDVRREPPMIRHGFEGDPSPFLPDQHLLTNASISGPTLLDFGTLRVGYPRFTLSGPAGTEVMITFAEGLWRTEGGKGRRSEVKGKKMGGYQDKIVLSGGKDTYEPLWQRTFRYVELKPAAPIRFQACEIAESGYPYKVEASFEADDPAVAPIWDAALRTARLCAGETYFDCPYYEQLQYAGDTRIQTLIHRFVSRDRRLAHQADEQFHWSMIPDGLTQSRYPSRQMQVIPPFSLWWILMKWDRWLHDESPPSLQGVDQVLEWWRGSREGFWPFADWVPEWGWGVPPKGSHSAIHELTYRWADSVARGLKENSMAAAQERAREWLAKPVEDDSPSHHREALRGCLARLAGETFAWPSDVKGPPCTYYFSFYQHWATRPSSYMDVMGPWKQMLQDGLTTFAENPEPVRSDCHAWSAHPVLGFLQIIAGAESTAPGWTEARIRPQPGSLGRFKARIPHPKGDMRVEWDGGRLLTESPVPFTLEWSGRIEKLPPGIHRR